MKVSGSSYVDLTGAVTPSSIVEDAHGRCTWHADTPGLFHLSTKGSTLYAVEVWKNAGYFISCTGTGRPLFKHHSVFTGSFVWQGYAEEGLYCKIGAGLGICPNIT